jgi:lysophospholipase L1-like esterase
MKGGRCSRLVVGLLLGLLLASLILNYYLFRQGRHYYLQLNATRLDPLGLSYYPTDPDAQNSVNPALVRVVFFGDSRAASWPAPPGLDQFEFINQGIGAQTSEQVVLRFDYHVAPLRPQILVVQVGINDLMKTIPLFPERRAVIVARCQENVHQIVSRATELGATVILTTIFPLAEVPLERRPFWSGEVALAIEELNVYIRSLAGENVFVLDAFAILADDSGLARTAYSRDFLHLNATGYDALNDALAHVLMALQDRQARRDTRPSWRQSLHSKVAPRFNGE